MKTYIFIFLSFFISGCSSLNLSTDYDPSIDFSAFKTYSWHSGNEYNSASLQYLDNIMDQRIRSTIDEQLQKKGYRKVGSMEANFWVNYSVVVKERADIRTYNNYGGMYPGFGFRGGYGYGGRPMMGMGMSTSNTQINYFKQGTLIIDVINPATNQLIWRGAADGRLPKTSDRQKSDELAIKYVTRILSDFPPKKNQQNHSDF